MPSAQKNSYAKGTYLGVMGALSWSPLLRRRVLSSIITIHLSKLGIWHWLILTPLIHSPHSNFVYCAKVLHSFLKSWSIIESRIVHHIGLSLSVSFLNWKEFLRFSLSLLTLTLLKNFGQLFYQCSSLWFIWCFFMMSQVRHFDRNEVVSFAVHHTTKHKMMTCFKIGNISLSFCPFPLALLMYNWQNHIYLKCIRWWFDICIQCVIITTFRLINTSITSHHYLVFVLEREKERVLLANFKYTTQYY